MRQTHTKQDLICELHSEKNWQKDTLDDLGPGHH